MYSQPARLPWTSPFNKYSVDFPPLIPGIPARFDVEEMTGKNSGETTNDPKNEYTGHRCHMCSKELHPDFVSRSIQKGSTPKKCWACGSVVRHLYAHGYRALKAPASGTVPEKAALEAPAPEASTSEEALVPETLTSEEALVPETLTSEAALVPEVASQQQLLLFRFSWRCKYTGRELPKRLLGCPC